MSPPLPLAIPASSPPSFPERRLPGCLLQARDQLWGDSVLTPCPRLQAFLEAYLGQAMPRGRGSPGSSVA